MAIETFRCRHLTEVRSTRESPIGMTCTFALVGLYLHVEKGYSGLQVQQVHMKLGRRKREWPMVPLPSHRGEMTAQDVLRATPGPDRDAAISDWCRSVWQAFDESHATIPALVDRQGQSAKRIR